MPGPITPISGAALPSAIRPAGETRGGSGFGDVLSQAIRSVEASGQNAADSVGRFLSGEGEELHTTILATQQAELSFDLFLQMRNKVVSAYQEIMRMPM
jgi:flagellar hook-basal body complex protein FliE